jgi:hypothetical protein
MGLSTRFLQRSRSVRAAESQEHRGLSGRPDSVSPSKDVRKPPCAAPTLGSWVWQDAGRPERLAIGFFGPPPGTWGIPIGREPAEQGLADDFD